MKIYSSSQPLKEQVITKILITIGLIIVVTPLSGIIASFLFPPNKKGENFAVLFTLISWGAVIYFVWFR